MRAKCLVEGCVIQKIKAFGLCNTHYMRFKRGKNPHVPSCRELSSAERLQANLGPQDLVTGCIEWQGSRDKCGYGRIWRGGGLYGATHRFAYELKRGSIPDGLHVLHKCDNPPCCNDDHLFVGTNADNTADKVSKGRQARLKGEDQPNSKLTAGDVIELRRLFASGLSTRKAAVLFGVHRSTAKDIKTRRSWAHLPAIA